MLGSSVLLPSLNFINEYHRPSIDLSFEATESDVSADEECLDTLQGCIPISQIAQAIAEDPSNRKVLFDDELIKSSERRYYKRTVLLSISFLFMYSSFYSIRNSQNSLVEDKTLSLASYGAVNSLMVFGGDRKSVV